MLHLKLK